MKQKLKIKSIIFDDENEIMVKQVESNENEIIINSDSNLIKYLDEFSGIERRFVHLNKLKVRLTNDKIYTLFDCHYIYRINSCCFDIYFNELVMGNVDDRNFKCDKLVVELEINNEKEKCFNENINFKIDDITIKDSVNGDRYSIIIVSNKQSSRYELFKYFTVYFELLNFIIGYFLIIKKVTYSYKKEDMVVETSIVDKYITAPKYVDNKLSFLNKLNNNTFKDAFVKYKLFSEKAKFQLSMYFMVTMKKNSYIELDVVNILQTFDGLYEKLSIYEDELIEYEDKMNDDIKKKIQKIKFSAINKKYNTDIDINNKIVNNIQRMNKVSYRNRLDKFFSHRNYMIFIEEQKANNPPFIKYKTLVDKCYNSRNKFSHVVDNEKCLIENENAVYIHKLLLIFRLHILQEIDLEKDLDSLKLNNFIVAINVYIKNNL